ncbi:hypothetical protein [Stenotrophomonas sp. GD03657]|uniref:hypothetical protein n=1 Tax=Stenotrophomonas sp. GD03657 TaxID=2975363 RepID=UPI002447F196|nr:hypothetical protein [Stenotrophomonas sp. GD03657]MDH2154236.1 hypothetical protein [Stenotrophomonas sp. GD03657]
MATVGQPLRMSNIFAVFGANRFSQCTRGNKVPNYPANGNVADNTGALRFSQFPGATTDPPAPTYNAQMQDIFASDYRPEGDNFRAWAGISFDWNGWAYDSTSSYATRQNFQWLLAGNAADFSIIAQLQGGSVPTGDPTGQWLSLNVVRKWELQNPSLMGSVDSYFSLTLRHNPSGQQWACNASLQAANGQLS